ncbi:hypothetical protein FRC07_000959 [Ceratobasidium sp. 392]|nr:hypothetical protein FRC07_000959 [Ceratobasidium sp. 392]
MPDENAKLLGAEYKGQKVLIRRSANYNVTVSSVKSSFKSLRSVSADRISISAFLDELDDTFEVPEELWSTTVSQIKRVTIVLDSATPAQPQPQAQSEPESNPATPSAPAETNTPAKADAPAKTDPKRRKSMATPKPAPKDQHTSTETIPDQPTSWKGVNTRNILTAMYINMNSGKTFGSENILTTPETTIPDLLAYITSGEKLRIGSDARFTFEFEGSSLKNKHTVADLGIGPKGGILNVYIYE